VSRAHALALPYDMYVPALSRHIWIVAVTCRLSRTALNGMVRLLSLQITDVALDLYLHTLTALVSMSPTAEHFASCIQDHVPY
jgi:hypothetical protein